MHIELTDDGTMDTVLYCSECGEERRYTYAGSTDVEESSVDAAIEALADLDTQYATFVEWAIKDATGDHECPRIQFWPIKG